MVKLNGVKDQRTADSAPSSSGSGLICFICGASNANWPLYCRSRNSEKMPFFPFLEYHVPPEGARPVDKTSGQVDSCTVCFSFLTQQWHAFEESATPVIKRIYWLKRSGIDSSGERAQSPVGSNQVRGEEFSNNNNTMAGENYDTQSPELLFPAVQSELSEGNFNATTSDLESANPICEDSAGPLVENSLLSAASRRSVGLETCYICSRRKPKEFMRSVHTRPQLKTETPFYPCLARHVPPTIAKQMDYLGKVLVCEACQKFLFRQWQVFQKNSTPLSERQYQLRSDPSLPREQQSQLSTMVCFICGVTQPATSGRFLYSRKHAPGHPYYPFLNNLPTPEGAMPLTKQGLTRACSGCRKSLHRQWKHFESAGISEEKREYRIRNEVMVQSTGSTTDVTETMTKIECYTCGEQCSESDLRPVHTKANTNPLRDNFYFPFIASMIPPKDSRPLDAEGRTFVCKKCHRQLRIEWEEFEQSKKPQEERSYVLKQSVAVTEDLDITSVCFLCGININASLHFKLYSYPHSGKGVHDGGPFFPFLSSREPATNAQSIDSEGTAVTCEICYNNLMMQWNAYEKSDVPEESNRWLRKYLVSSINCYLCYKQVSRFSSGAVNKQLITFPPNHRPPKNGIVVNNGRDVVLCNNCQREVQRDLEAMDDSNGVLGRLTQQWDDQDKDKVRIDFIDSISSGFTDSLPVLIYTPGWREVL